MENKHIKRKRKTFGSYLKLERYQAKRKLFGRGKELSEDVFNYFVRIMAVNMNDFSDEEDREIFIENVFEQTAEKEMDISCNQLGCRAIEMFLPWANNKILVRFIDALSQDLRLTCCDRFASHVLQQLIVVVSTRLQKVQSSQSEVDASQESQLSSPDVSGRFKSWLQQVGQFVVNNLQEFVMNDYANHIIRTILECFSGLPPGSTTKEKKWEKANWLPYPESTVSPIDEGFSLVQECGRRILQMSQVFDDLNKNLISGLLQTVLLTVRKVDSKLCRKILLHLLDYCFMGENQATARLMETMITVAKRETFTHIYMRCFRCKLQSLSLEPNANFCVQSLIKHCKNKDQFEPIFEELCPNFEALLQHNKHGVLVALGQSCQRLRCKQKEFFMQLQTVFHCVEPERQALFPLLVAQWVDYETWCERTKNLNGRELKMFVSLPGSLLVQTMLNFCEPIKIIKALLDTDLKYLLNLLCDRHGSYIGDAFFNSQMVGEKQKTKFFHKLQGSFVALVVSDYGSRVLDNIWLWASLKMKKLILDELAPSEAVVNSVRCGSIFSNKCGLSLFKRRPNDWEEAQTKTLRATKLFSDIIDT